MITFGKNLPLSLHFGNAFDRKLTLFCWIPVVPFGFLGIFYTTLLISFPVEPIWEYAKAFGIFERFSFMI